MALKQRLAGASVVLFDGTLWRDDEMMRAGVGPKTGQRMGHMSVTGPDGRSRPSATSRSRRKIFIHINNTNPILLEDGRAARVRRRRAGKSPRTEWRSACERRRE